MALTGDCMKKFCFTVDDNIRFLRQINEAIPRSIFDHPYLAMYRRLHDSFGVSVQLNLFYEEESFSLSDMTDIYRSEWESVSDWLKLSFHSRCEIRDPYKNAGYDELFLDCKNVEREILRFASPSSLAKTTTLHYCLATNEGLRALRDAGVLGLLGLFGTADEPRVSYGRTPEECRIIRDGGIALSGDMAYLGIDVVLNCFTRAEILERLESLCHRPLLKLMIHEQYFYPDYPRYQSDFEDKLSLAFGYLYERGFTSTFAEDILK